ncbi:MAG: YihA family ribosome biogenesis GTP-binding protein [Saprospiraceae bacterium]|nr:YihA family ribosome biogenesis GTP-binding protein [Saprospiraceae bacterium]MCB9309041.1 YihA family ribosome biogenesis GTP-binding protein [Lewinellaceae bacterium]
MIIQSIEFSGSFPRISACPRSEFLEFAFIGRSNVGKSSLINMLSNRKAIAKVSVTPGKTQLINFFKVNEGWHLVDLPGYGYARVNKKMLSSFTTMIKDYLSKRENLVNTFVLIDIRHDLQKADAEFLDWCGESQIPISIIFTKIDKISKQQIPIHIERINSKILQTWSELPPQFISSAVTNQGKEDILSYIESILSQVHATNH